MRAGKSTGWRAHEGAKQFGDGRRRVQVIEHGAEEGFAGCRIRRRRKAVDGCIPPVQRLLGLFERLHRPVDRLAIVGAQHRQAEHFAIPFAATELLRAQEFVDGDEVAEALRHLLALDLQEAVVHPHIGHDVVAEGATRLGDLVLVVREDQVEPAAVNIECLAEIAPAHG